MSEYHCNVEKVVVKSPFVEQNVDKVVPYEEKEYRPDINTPGFQPVNESFLDKLFNLKNLHIVIIITIIYVILNNKDFILFINRVFPFLVKTTTEINLMGTILFGILMGVIVITYNSF